MFAGAPCRIRTYDALIRSQVLYPAEVRARLKQLVYLSTRQDVSQIP